MHSRLLIVCWRRKLFFLGASLLFLLALWFWGFLYTTHITEDGGKIVSVRELMLGSAHDGRHESLLQRLGFHERHDPALDGGSNGVEPHGAAHGEQGSVQLEGDEGGVKFVKPTPGGLRSAKVRHTNDWDAIMQDRTDEGKQINQQPGGKGQPSRHISDEMRMAAERQSHYEHELKRMGVPVIAGLGPGGRPPPAQRLVHFDLKGAPPKVSYLRRLMPILKTLGATGILLEYEDMFPYGGSLLPLAARNAYNRDEILELLKSAFALGLTVIPLVQTFGHLEYALKLKEFAHLRETEDSPQALCPSYNASMAFVEELLTQVIEYHMPAENGNLLHKEDIERSTPKLTHIHIGCDEVYRLAECPRCRHRLKDQLFLDHVYNVATIVRRRWPHLRVIVWDDMLRHMALDALQASGIGKLVEPMIWVYAEDIYKFVQSATWEKYAAVFRTAWAASAFKGAHGEGLLMPPIRRHLENTLRWLAVMQGEGNRFSHGLQGLALTGWQRYDHFAVLCELLPAALPSLAICLSTAAKGYFDVSARTNPILSSLTCPEPTGEHHAWLELHRDSMMVMFSRCMFPGSMIYRFILRLATLTTETEEYTDAIRQRRGWLTDYNIRHNFSSAARVDDLLGENYRLLNAVSNLARTAASTLTEVYDHWTYGEFIEQRIFPMLEELKRLERAGEGLKKRRVWPQRPLPYLKPFEVLGIDEKT
ncbi:AGAP004270-PA [Anopheles gambiae str. PEST]|uniref:beta-N-acetylhexosaminidase n=1 Tax=Anopheles gambiae TaxID=7165 RepID=Q7PQL4_ANOGA|nr:AGAP004270-PA [Anopheles gambiae str. PEST]